MDKKVGQLALDEVKEWLEQQFQPWVEASCPCGGERFDQWSEGERFGFAPRLVSCRQCGQLLTSPRLRTDLLETLFGRWYRRLYFNTSHLSELQWQQERQRGKKALDFILALRTPQAGARWLDYGCGAGGFVSVLNQRGYQATGYDIDASYLHFGRSKGAAVGALRWPEGLQVVSLIRVLHYLPDMPEALDDIVSHLRPGGLVYIDLPGVRQWLRGPSCRGQLRRMASIFHLTYFDLRLLEALMSRHQLRLVGGSEEIRALFEFVPGSPPLRLDQRPLRAFLSNTRRGSHFWWLWSFLPSRVRRLLDRELAASSTIKKSQR
jgi:SAM-dependent methyltransferase